VAEHGLPSTLYELRNSPVITAGVIGRQLRLSAYQGEERQEVMLEPTLISDHFPFLRQGILAGLGLGLVPDYVVQPEVASGQVLLALQEYRLSIFGSHMYLMYLPGRHQTRAVRTCIDFLLAKAGHGMAPVPEEAPQ
jgi:DNA-binding transcriptional LysR family regulator